MNRAGVKKSLRRDARTRQSGEFSIPDRARSSAIVSPLRPLFFFSVRGRTGQASASISKQELCRDGGTFNEPVL
jgi:hypothetical protein